MRPVLKNTSFSFFCHIFCLKESNQRRYSTHHASAPISPLSFLPPARERGSNPSLAKVLHRAGGRTLIEHVVRACQPLKPRAIIAVVGHQAEDVSAVLKPLGCANRRCRSRSAEPATPCSWRAARLAAARNLPLFCRATRRWFAPKRSRRWLARTGKPAPPPPSSPPILEQPEGLWPHLAAQRRHGRSHRRGFRANRRSARDQRNQLQHLRLHARQALALPRAAAARQCPSRALSHRRHCHVARAGRNRVAL